MRRQAPSTRWRPRSADLSRQAGEAARSPLLPLAVLLAIAIGIGIVHNRLHSAGRTDPLLSIVQFLIYPAQKGSAHTEAGLTFRLDGLTNAQRLTSENARLTEENARLKQENESLRLQAAEAARLRAEIGLVHTEKKPPIAGEVVGWLPNPHFESLIVARGTRDGVHEKMVVRNADGLIGQVIAVGPNTCEVMLLSDLNSGVGALVRRDGKTQGVGIVQGLGRGVPPELQDLRRETDVRPGDSVVTSGNGNVFPPDIPIGVITEVRSVDAHFLKTARITPFVPHPGALREVLILQ